MSVDSYDYIMTGNSCENSQRIEQLERLCRDMYHVIYGEDTSTQTCEMFRQRMEQLGLLEGEQ